MLRNYILVALRRLARERVYVLINVFSLALGMASVLVLTLYLHGELTYDRHNLNHDRIYRVIARFQRAGADVTSFATSQVGIGPLLTRDYPQLGTYARFRPWSENVFEYEQNQRQWERVYLADPAVFEIFTHHVIYGDSHTAFRDPYSIAISESVSRYYFGEKNPIGKNLSSGDHSYKVSLVFADLPENSHLRYDALLPMSLMQVLTPGSNIDPVTTLWSMQVFTYLLVQPDFEPETFGDIGRRFFQQYMSERSAQLKMTFRPEFQPLTEAHFGEKLSGDLPTGNIFYVYAFTAVALFIVVVACINYVNLATARAGKRAKEVGMRKVLGARREQVAGQFFGESLTFSVIAAVLAWIIAVLAAELTPLGSLMGKEHLLDWHSQPMTLLTIVLLGAFIALAAGAYPALYLSNISPLAALTHVKRSWRSGLSMRRILVLSQLSISIGVIACTSMMLSQLRYLESRPLGFDRENRLIVTLRGYDVLRQIATLKSELRNQPNVVDVTTIGSVPGAGNAINVLPIQNNDGAFESLEVDNVMVGLNFIESMKLKLLEGRGFSEEIATDKSEAMVVNESFVKRMGWQSALGKGVRMGPSTVARVIGIVEDFHYASLYNKIGPLLMIPIDEDAEHIPEGRRAVATTSLIVVMNGENMRNTISSVRTVIGRFDPKFYFEPTFLEERLHELYQSDAKLMKLTGIFAGVCILISLMGLYGLTLFSTEERTKEIGIRKVLGASDAQIVSMFCRHLVPLVLLAAIPASLLSYYAMSIWLNRFAYRDDIHFMTFAVATVVVGLVALLTAIWQSARAARSNPVDSLRYE